MPRLRIIVLDSPASSAARASFRLALWADVPAARQAFYAATNVNSKSAWINALTGDNTNIQNGSVAESVVVYSPDSTKTLGQMEADAQAIWQSWQTQITNTNFWPNYGSTWDGTTWVIATVA